MIELNAINGADRILRFVQSLILKEFLNEWLIGVEMGVAYGGGVEALGTLWKGRGTVYGFDTFEGHPKELATSPEAHEAWCMDDHYEKYGTEKLSYDYQRFKLNIEGLYNVILVKGLVNESSCEHLPKIHYAFLDLDILASMKIGYEAVKDKIVKGGFLCLHDVIEHPLLPELTLWYNEIKKDERWEVIFEGKKEGIAVLRRV